MYIMLLASPQNLVLVGSSALLLRERHVFSEPAYVAGHDAPVRVRQACLCAIIGFVART